MKKILFVVIAILLLSGTVYADEPIDDISSSISNEMKEFEESLPDYIRDILPKELFSGDYSSLLNGEIGYKTFIDATIDFILADLPNILTKISLILVLIIVSSIFNTLASSFDSDSLKSAYGLCSSLCISLTVFNMISSLLEAAISYMNTLCTVMNSFAPILTVMHIMSGNISSAALGNASMLMFIALIENILIAVLTPIISVCMCFSLIKAISGNIDISGISKFIKSSFVRLPYLL